MGYLAAVVPAARGRRLPLSRDQLMLLMAAANEFFLAVDIYLAHSISGTITRYEWIPIVFGPIAAVLLLLAGLIARRWREAASLMATVVLGASIGVGLAGAYLHWIRAILPHALPGEQISVPLLVWAPPILGPLTFSLVGVLGISAAWIENPPESGRLTLIRRLRLPLPYSKTRAYLFLVGLGCLATVISSVLDHARTGFANPWLWIPTVVGVFGVAVAIGLGLMDDPEPVEIATYGITMLALIAVGLAGAWFHIQSNLTAEGTFVGERFLRGAPALAPLLFANMGILGLIALLDPSEPGSDRAPGA
jgi:hypothetical protein